jgi:ubiquinone/menaquinone biosynthesis C-methylase UbiE
MTTNRHEDTSVTTEGLRSAGSKTNRRSTSRPDYGLDAPGAFRAALIGGAVALIVAGLIEAVAIFWAGAVLLGYAAAHLWSSKVGKRRLARRIVGSIAWRGDEHVLDVGCGRGVMLVEVGKRVPRGRVAGIDVWAAKDQSHNHARGAHENAAIEGVAGRVEVLTADARSIPFDDRTFDAVVSSFVLHNLHRREDRLAALAEIVRVLVPGGIVTILDIFKTREYRDALVALGVRDVRRRRVLPLWLMATSAVTGTTPGPSTFSGGTTTRSTARCRRSS